MGFNQRTSFLTPVVCFLTIQSIVIARPPQMKPSFISIIQSGNDSFTNPKSSCAYPPRDFFDAQSAYKSTCIDVSITEGQDLPIQNLNNSVCLALRFISSKLCTNETNMRNLSSVHLSTESVLKSNMQDTVESFCKEFEKSVELRKEDSLPEIDTFFKSFFGKQKADGINYCPQFCNGTTTKINVVCTLTNIGFEMYQSINNTIKSAVIPVGGESNAVHSNQTLSNTDAANSTGNLKIQSQDSSSGLQTNPAIQVQQPPLESSSTKSSNSPSPTPHAEAESNKAEDIKVQEKPIQSSQSPLKQQSNPAEVNDKPSVSKPVGPDPPQGVSTEASTSGSKSKLSAGIASGKQNDVEDKIGLVDGDGGNDDALGGEEDRPIEVDSSESVLPSDQGKSNSLPKENPAAGNAAQDKIDQTVRNHLTQQRKDNTVFKGTSDPNFIFSEDSDQESSGYFGYFITFIGICAFCFIMFHNKKRLIALVVEGRKPRGGRRRSGTGSGAAAYRKLENNFE